MSGITPEAILQLKDLLSLLAIVWLLFWTYRYFIPDLMKQVVNLLIELHKEENDEQSRSKTNSVLRSD